MKLGKSLAAVRPHTWRSEADPFWLIMGGGNGTCDAVVDVFKDDSKIGLTLRIKLNDPSVPAPFLEFQVFEHDLRAFAAFILQRLKAEGRQPECQPPHRLYPDPKPAPAAELPLAPRYGMHRG